MDKRAKELIKLLSLCPHPEGGYYREIFRSETKIKSPKNKKTRNAATGIYFLLPEGEASRFHRLLHDETWHFYEGDPLELIEVSGDGRLITKTSFGQHTDKINYTHSVKAGNWQAAYSTGKYSLVGCTVAPGFNFKDFEFLKKNNKICPVMLKKNPALINLL